jgi:hypothetical protein
MADEAGPLEVYFDERLVARIMVASMGKGEAYGTIEFTPDFDSHARPAFAEVAEWERRMSELASIDPTEEDDDSPSSSHVALMAYCEAWKPLMPRLRVTGVPGELAEIQFPLDPACWPRGDNWANVWWEVPEEKLDTETRLPSHVAGWAVVTHVAAHGAGLSASLRCPCGCSRLEFHFPGPTHTSGSSGSLITSTAKLPGEDGETRYYFGIKAICPDCGGQRVVFDADLHGWYLATSGPEYAAQMSALPRPPLQPWRCVCCDGLAHEGSASFTFDSPLDFRDRVGGKIPGERRCEAFSWFAMDIRCCGCGLETDNWVDYETR